MAGDAADLAQHWGYHCTVSNLTIQPSSGSTNLVMQLAIPQTTQGLCSTQALVWAIHQRFFL
jgi:hypothetical protein